MADVYGTPSPVKWVGPHSNVVFGVVDMKPLAGFPTGRVRLRMRNDDFLRAFVRTRDSIRQFIVGEVDGSFVPIMDLEQGANYRANTINPLAEMIAEVDKEEKERRIIETSCNPAAGTVSHLPLGELLPEIGKEDNGT